MVNSAIIPPKLTLLLIALVGLILRFVDYEKVPPFGVTWDELAYPWSGMTLIETGIPRAWSWLNAYTVSEMHFMFENPVRIVTPWINHPPLYSFILGKWVLINGAKDFIDVRLSTIRIIPIILSFFYHHFYRTFCQKFF